MPGVRLSLSTSRCAPDSSELAKRFALRFRRKAIVATLRWQATALDDLQ